MLTDAESVNPILQRERTLAIVIGTSEWPFYPDFNAAPSFRRSAYDIVDYLRARNGFNLPPLNVKAFIDSADDAPEILRQTRRFIRDRRAALSSQGTPATDLLFYYVGHGGLTDSNAFFLAIRATEEDDPLGTSITAESLGAMVRERAAGLRTYLVLDCCFAASVSRVFMSAGPLSVVGEKLRDALPSQGDVLATQEGKFPAYGTALLCASGPRDAARAPPNLPHTMFTGGLLDVLQNGDLDAPLWLSLDDIQRLVRARLEAQFASKAVLPQVHAPQQRMGRVDLVPLFPNVARRVREQQVRQSAAPVGQEEFSADRAAQSPFPPLPVRAPSSSSTPNHEVQKERPADDSVVKARSSNPEVAPTPRLSLPNWERTKIFALISSIFLTIVLQVYFPRPTLFQYDLIRIIYSLAISGATAFLPGAFQISIPKYLLVVGSLAMFLVVFYFSPAELVVVPPAETPQTSLLNAPRLAFNVCHGELESVCKQHPFDQLESCAAGGADPEKSCLKFCGKPLGPGYCEVLQTATSIGGNQCGYAWFQVRCF